MSFQNKSKQYTHVPAPEGSEASLRPGDPLGSFVGYLRRPKSSSTGLVAQFFGENGPDADVIAALHLTQFLDANVKVTVWMMKDRQGRVMKKDGEYIKLTEFIAVIRRPVPSNLGQVAQFFGENGPNSDAINVLNQSSFLDALVYIEMHQAMAGMTTSDIQTVAPSDELNEKASRMTPTEAQEFKKMQKRAQEAMRTLTLHGFFRQESVLAALGRDDEFQAWIASQPCCHPSDQPCDLHPVTPWSLPGGRRYQKIPLCHEHAALWESGNAVMPDGSGALGFAQTQTITMVQRWAVAALAKQLRIPSDRLPTPGAVYAWAVDKKLHNLMPPSFKAFLG